MLTDQISKSHKNSCLECLSLDDFFHYVDKIVKYLLKSKQLVLSAQERKAV